MSSAVTITTVAQPPAAPVILSREARDYAREASAQNTRRAYRAAWQDFSGWCAATGVDPLPAMPEAVGSFLAARAGTHKAASLSMRLVAIGQAHRLAGHRLDTGHPAIRETMKGIRRKHGSAPAKKEAAVSAVIRDAVDGLAKRPGLRPLRDRALLLVGFAAALRRSELVALDVADVTFVQEGVILTLRRAKTDQEVTLKAWLKAAGIEAGPIFRAVSRHGLLGPLRLSDKDVARVVKASVAAAGYDPEVYGGHSLRSGFITSAARAGVAEAHIQNQSRHRSLPVLRGYIRRGSLFVDNAAAKVEL
jgi:integrase